MIEAVIMSVDYGDFLEATLPGNAGKFDHIVLLTTEKDLHTQRLGEQYGCTVVVTDVFYKNESTLNKGFAINLGYEHLKHKQWVANLDADILLSDTFLDVFLGSERDKEKFYWADRFVFDTYREWREFLESGKDLKDKPPLEHGPGIGYLQIFHYDSRAFTEARSKTQDHPYPEEWKTLYGSDIRFRDKWPQSSIEKLDFACFHLGEPMKNWQGRVAPVFA